MRTSELRVINDQFDCSAVHFLAVDTCYLCWLLAIAGVRPICDIVHKPVVVVICYSVEKFYCTLIMLILLMRYSLHKGSKYQSFSHSRLYLGCLEQSSLEVQYTYVSRVSITVRDIFI